MVNTENLLSVLGWLCLLVQRSSLSHLLSGRNKPSLDFILKIVDVFPDVDLYWILNGREFS
jgi:hypothetical protein